MKNVEVLLIKDLESIIQDLEKWAKKNGITKDQEFFRNVDRIYNVSDTLRALHAGVIKR